MIGIEAITVISEGPICLLLVLMFMMKSPFRHTLTIVVVTGELYGTVLYFLSSFYEGKLLFICLLIVVVKIIKLN